MSTTSLEQEMLQIGADARDAAQYLRKTDGDNRAAAIRAMAKHVRVASDDITKANTIDMKAGRDKGLSPAMLDRLALDQGRIEAMAKGLEAVADLPDPIGHEDERWTRPNGLTIAKVRTPLGVIGMIYESRPNVTADAASLCLKSGNASILRGGSEATNSNKAIHSAILLALTECDLPTSCVQYVNTTDRAAVGHLLSGLNNTVDLIIPRGGKGLVERVQSDARVPVLAHLEGRNHTYVHASADPQMACDVVLNAKMRRTGICGSTETVIFDLQSAAAILPTLADVMRAAGCHLKGDARAQSLVENLDPASDVDFSTEYLDAIMNIKIVDHIDGALAHIDHYGSGHTDAIIAQDQAAADQFLRHVDSAIVVHNASTQYADGGEFGFGAEIGIATGRLHARGPVGAQHLTSYKYHVLGTGQIRP